MIRSCALPSTRIRASIWSLHSVLRRPQLRVLNLRTIPKIYLRALKVSAHFAPHKKLRTKVLPPVGITTYSYRASDQPKRHALLLKGTFHHLQLRSRIRLQGTKPAWSLPRSKDLEVLWEQICLLKSRKFL